MRSAAVTEFARLKNAIIILGAPSSSSSLSAVRATADSNSFSFILRAILELTCELPEDANDRTNSSTNSSSAITSTYLGLHYLLDMAASALLNAAARAVCITELSPYMTLLPSTLRKVAVLPLKRPPLVLPGTSASAGARKEDAFFSSVRSYEQRSAAEVEKAAAAGSEVVNVHEAASAATASTPTVTAAKAKTSSTSAAAEKISAPLLRSVSSITLTILKMLLPPTESIAADGAADGAATLQSAAIAIGKQHVPQYLTWLAVPEVDIREDVGTLLALLIVEGDSRCVSTGGSGDGGGGGGAVVDLNLIAAVFRQLGHKLAPRDKPGDQQQQQQQHTVDEKFDALSAIGALRCFGSMVEAMVHKCCLAMQQRQQHDIAAASASSDFTALLSETQRRYAQLMSMLCSHLCVGGASGAAGAGAGAAIPATTASPNGLQATLQQVVALEVLVSLCRRGFIDCSAVLPSSSLSAVAEVNSSSQFFTAVLQQHGACPPALRSRLSELVLHADYRIAAVAIDAFACMTASSASAGRHCVYDCSSRLLLFH